MQFPRHVSRGLLWVLGACAVSLNSATHADPGLRVAVAANFREAAAAVAADYRRDTGMTVVLSSAATGVLTAQWRRGAPFDLLLAADRVRPEALAREGYAAGAPRCYAVGALVLLGADSLEEALADRSRSIAIANPRSAPYGAAATAVLERPEFPGHRERRVVRGSNVMQAYQFYTSGATDLALVARSLDRGEGLAIPAGWHPPIEQYAVVNPRSSKLPQARAFLDYLVGPRVKHRLTALGYQSCS